VVPILIYLVIQKRQVILERNAFENPVYGQSEPGPDGDGNISYEQPEGYMDVSFGLRSGFTAPKRFPPLLCSTQFPR